MTFEQVPVTHESGPTLDLETMGQLCFISAVVQLENGSEITPSHDDADKMGYGKNNGFISFVTEGGLQYVAKYSAEKEAALIAAGYENKSLGVPFSNGEKPRPGTQEFNSWLNMINE